MKYRWTPVLVLLLGFLLAGFATGVSAQFEPCGASNTPPSCSSSVSSQNGVLTVVVTDPNGVCLVDQNVAININTKGIGVVTPPSNPHVVTGYKVDHSKKAILQITVWDCCKPSSSRTCDPVLTSIIRVEGKPVVDTYSDLPREEGFITIANGTPGLRRIVAMVNGEKFNMTGLKDGEEVTLDVTAAMAEGFQNTITLVGYGKPGGSAAVMIWDGLTN